MVGLWILIESKTMTAPILTNVSADQLNFEVSQSKRCLANHGINAEFLLLPMVKVPTMLQL